MYAIRSYYDLDLPGLVPHPQLVGDGLGVADHGGIVGPEPDAPHAPEVGAVIAPIVPAFYAQPKSIERNNFV